MRRIVKANDCRCARLISILELDKLFIVWERRVISSKQFYKLADEERELHGFPFIYLSI